MNFKENFARIKEKVKENSPVIIGVLTVITAGVVAALVYEKTKEKIYLFDEDVEALNSGNSHLHYRSNKGYGLVVISEADAKNYIYDVNTGTNN